MCVIKVDITVNHVINQLKSVDYLFHILKIPYLTIAGELCVASNVFGLGLSLWARDERL